MYSPSLGHIWRDVPMLLKFCALIVWLIGVYSLFSACRIMFRVRSLSTQAQIKGAAVLSLAVLRTQSANMRQLLGAAFYLFGFIFFLTLPWAFVTLGDGRFSPLIPIMENFIVFFDFAAKYIFSVLLFLHFLQWFVRSRIDSCAMRIGSQNFGSSTPV